MAAVDVVMPAPPPPPPAPMVRISRLALAAADSFVCLWIATLWVVHACFALLATAVIVCLVICGLECTGSAWRTVVISLLFVAILWPLAAKVLIMVVELYTNQKGAAISKAVVKAHLTATMVFAFLEAFGILMKILAAKDSTEERISCVVMVVPPLGISVMCCLVSIPGCAVKVWRMRRCTSFASVVPI